MLIAIILAFVAIVLATRFFYTRKIVALKTVHKTNLRLTFLKAFDAGYASGNIDGQHMILLENITAKSTH